MHVPSHVSNVSRPIVFQNTGGLTWSIQRGGSAQRHAKQASNLHGSVSASTASEILPLPAEQLLHAEMSDNLRAFRFWEQICSTMNISLGFELQGPVAAELVLRAWSLVRREYPYFKARMTQGATGQLLFRTPSDSEAIIDLYEDIPLESVRHTGQIPWQGLLVDFANTERDHTKSLIHLQLHSSGTEEHWLLVTINHAGIDGLSTFHVFRSFFAKLGALAAGSQPQAAARKANVDIGARVPPIDVAKLPPLAVPADFMPMLPPLAGEPGGRPPYVEAVFAELSMHETARLVARCREVGATVQGAVSAAAGIAIAQAQKADRPLPQTLLMQCPANMRRQVTPPVGDDETSCAASFLWWPQRIAPGERLWDVARRASEAIRREAEGGGGLAFWARMLASKTLPEFMAAGVPPYTPPYTITSSSVGINPIVADNGPMHVSRAHMMLSTFGVTSEKEAGTMTHAHTFADKLHLTLTYSMPAVGHKRGKAMAATQLAVLQVLASDNFDVTAADFME